MPLTVASCMAQAGGVGAVGDLSVFLGESYVFDGNGDLTSANATDVVKSRLVWPANMPRMTVSISLVSGAGRVLPLDADAMAAPVTAAMVQKALPINDAHNYREFQVRNGGGFAILADA